MAIFEDEIVNNKPFQHNLIFKPFKANLIFTELWTLTNEILLNIMQKFKFYFLKQNYTDWGVCLSSISETSHNFFTRFFRIYRGILEPKNDASVLHKIGFFSNKTCCGLTALFLKTKIYFFCCNFVNKQINKNS